MNQEYEPEQVNIKTRKSEKLASSELTDDYFRGASFSAQGNRLLIDKKSGLWMFDRKNKAPIFHLQVGWGEIAYSYDGNMMIYSTLADENQTRLYFLDLETGKIQQTWNLPYTSLDEQVFSLEISPDKQKLMILHKEDTQLFDIQTKKLFYTWKSTK